MSDVFIISATEQNDVEEELVLHKKVFVILGFPVNEEGELVACIRELGGLLLLDNYCF